MYGVPEDLNLSFLIGTSLLQVHLMPHQLNLVFDSHAMFTVEGDWLLLTDEGVIDRYQPWPRLEPYHFHRVLERKIIGWSVSSPMWLDLVFEGRIILRLFDTWENYESLYIQPGDIVI